VCTQVKRYHTSEIVRVLPLLAEAADELRAAQAVRARCVFVCIMASYV
jgi:hypothetical protein